MEINDIVICGGIRYKVVGRVGAGGQGAVWKVENQSDKKLYALKIIEENNPNVRMDKINNIRRIVREKLEERTQSECLRRQVNFAFPMQNYVGKGSNDAGYVMELVSGETLNKMLMTGAIEKMSVNEKLSIVKKIADALDYLHSIGYCYTDINWGNFMYDKRARIMHVIDCENIACKADLKNGTCSFLKGTGFFIAPEVGFGGIVSYASDRYALATLIFRVLMNNYIQSAYHGAAMYTAVPACQNMLDVAEMEDDDDIDRNWRVFIFDENNRSNGIDNIFTKSKSPEIRELRAKLDFVIKVWSMLDPRLKELFQHAFEDPFNDKEPTPTSGRPLPYTWVKTIDEILGGKGGKVKAGAVKPVNAHAKQHTSAKTVTPVAAAPTHAPATQSKQAFTPPAKPKRDVNTAFKPFSPTAAAPQPAPAKPARLPDKPYVITSDNIAVRITDDEFTIFGAQVGMRNYAVVGELRKAGDKYEFTSRLQSNVAVYGEDGVKKSTLSNGKCEILESGDYFKSVVHTRWIKIVY